MFLGCISMQQVFRGENCPEASQITSATQSIVGKYYCTLPMAFFFFFSDAMLRRRIWDESGLMQLRPLVPLLSPGQRFCSLNSHICRPNSPSFSHQPTTIRNENMEPQ